MPELATNSLPRADVLGVGVHAINLAQAVEQSERLLASGGKGYVCLTGVHGVMEAQDDPEFRAVLNHAYLCVPDGMPTVWVGRWQGHRSMERVYGPDYMMAMCERSPMRGYRHFLCGGGPGVAARLKARLETQVRGLQIVGTYTPPFGPLTSQQESELINLVEQTHPDIFWVGLSTPKQERFMARYLDKLDVKLMAGVGAAFDLHAGLRKDAPAWMKRAGLQWVYRMAQEPRRLGPRYLNANPRFLLRLGRQVVEAIGAQTSGAQH